MLYFTVEIDFIIGNETTTGPILKIYQFSFFLYIQLTILGNIQALWKAIAKMSLDDYNWPFFKSGGEIMRLWQYTLFCPLVIIRRLIYRTVVFLFFSFVLFLFTSAGTHQMAMGLGGTRSVEIPVIADSLSQAEFEIEMNGFLEGDSAKKVYTALLPFLSEDFYLQLTTIPGQEVPIDDELSRHEEGSLFGLERYLVEEPPAYTPLLKYDRFYLNELDSSQKQYREYIFIEFRRHRKTGNYEVLIYNIDLRGNREKLKTLELASIKDALFSNYLKNICSLLKLQNWCNY